MQIVYVRRQGMDAGIAIVDIGCKEALFQINDSFEAVFFGTYGNAGLCAVRKRVKTAVCHECESRFFLGYAR